jgi:hypothetical protein
MIHTKCKQNQLLPNYHLAQRHACIFIQIMIYYTETTFQILFIYELFNEAVSSSNHVASNGTITEKRIVNDVEHSGRTVT